MGFTTKEVALKLGVTTQTVINWTNRGLLTCLRTPGGHRRYDELEVDKFSNRYVFSNLNQSTSQNAFKNEHVIILTQDADYAGLIKEFIEVCFNGFRGSPFNSNTFQLVSNPFRAAYWLGASESSVLIVDIEFLTPQVRSELERLVDESQPALKKIVVLSRLGQADKIRTWSAVGSIHLRNKPLSQLVKSFADVFDPSHDMDEI